MAEITVSDFDELTEELQEIYNEAARTKIADSVGFQLYNAFDTNLLNYEHQILHGTEGHRKLAEGEDIPKSTSEQGKQVIALYKLFLIIGNTLKKAIRGKLNQLNGLLQPQRLSGGAMQFA